MSSVSATQDEKDRQRRKREAIVNHIAAHRLSLKSTITKLFCDGNESSASGVILTLRKQGRIEAEKGLHKNFSYYRLTEKEATKRGLPYNPKNPTLREDLAVLWFCCMPPGPRTRHLITREEQAEIL